jgi:PAS domain S-box-containing protein
MSTRILVLDSKPAKDYGLAVGITLLALLARFALDPFLGDHLPYVTFFVPATITTAYAGFGASLMTVVLGGLAADYFFMSPRHSFVLAGEANYVGLASYFVVTFTIVGFGQALQKARQHAETVTEALRREGIDRTRAEAALRESESRFRSVADTAPVLTWMSDSTKLRTWINKAWLEFTGLTVEQELGHGWSEFVHRDDFERCLSHYTNSFDARAPFTIEYRLRRHDGEYRWFLDNGMPRFGAGGEFIGYIGSCVDITDRKRGEAQLLESEERFRTLADNISQFAWMADAAGWLFWYNQRWYDYTGTTFEDMQGWGWQKVHHPDYIDHVLEKWRSAHTTGEPWEDTFPLRGRDGTYRWFLSRAMPIRDGEGKVVRWFGTNTDITELREAEAALRKSEERYRHLYESIDEGFCIIEVLFDERKKAVDYVFLEINPSFERQTGIRDAQGRRMRDIAPQHESHWFDLYGTIALTGESKRFEYPAVELQRWYEGYAYRVGEGHERKVGILFNDITERKQAEEKLRENEKRLRLALEAGQMGAWDVDLLTGLVTWDAKQFELFGLGPRQQPATMDQFYAMVHSDDVPSLTDAVARAETIGSFSHEFRIVRADGTVRWIAASGAIMKNEGGQAVRMVGVNYDVTDRRQTEARLRSFAVELEQLVEARTQELVQSQERLRSLATELNLAEQRERKRLAGELHDYLAQLLVLCRLNLGQVRRTGLPSKAEDMVKETEEVLNNALTYTRTLMAELSPPVLQQQGLPAGLRWLAEQMERRGLTVRVDVGNAAEVRLPDDCAVLLFQSVRELLLNALKHAGCEEVNRWTAGFASRYRMTVSASILLLLQVVLPPCLPSSACSAFVNG